MRTSNWNLSSALFMMVAGAMFLAQSAFAGIEGTVHDLGSFVTMPENRICVACHTPHNAISATDAPLWNHELSGGGHTPYASGAGTSMDAVVAAPAGVSLLCLSCHDGSIAVDSFGGDIGTSFISGAANLTLDLSDDHPISFTYDLGLSNTDGELEDPTTAMSGVGGGSISDDMLFGIGNDQLECATCHDVHNGPGATGALLVKDNTGSALCLTCHQK